MSSYYGRMENGGDHISAETGGDTTLQETDLWQSERINALTSPMRASNLQFQGYWDIVLSMDFTYQYYSHSFFGVSTLRTEYSVCMPMDLDFQGFQKCKSEYICILHKLVRIYVLHYSRDLFLRIRQRKKVGDWGCGCNLVLDFVFGVCQHFLSRLYLPICVSHQPYGIAGDNQVNMIYGYMVDIIVTQIPIEILEV